MKSADFKLPQDNPIRRGLPFVVVCEGHGDVCFIAELLEHGRVDVCNVGCPTQKHFGDGKDAIPKYLKAIATDKKGLRGVLVVVDADDDPNGNFEAMADALEDATFTRPRKPFTLEESNGIRVGVFLMPKENQNGTLEDLLLEAVFKTSPKARDCVGKFADCVGHVVASGTPVVREAAGHGQGASVVSSDAEGITRNLDRAREAGVEVESRKLARGDARGSQRSLHTALEGRRSVDGGPR